MKDLNTKNMTFKNDIMNAMREIKDICRTNSTSINKLHEDMKVIRDELTYKIEHANKYIEIHNQDIHDINTNINNFKSITEKEIFDNKSECGFLNKSVKKIM